MQEKRGWEQVEREQVQVSVNSSVRKSASSFLLQHGYSRRARQRDRQDNPKSSLVVAASTKSSLLFLHSCFFFIRRNSSTSRSTNKAHLERGDHSKAAAG